MNALLTVRPLESQEQALFFRWLESLTLDREPVRPHCYAVPNGGSRHPAEAANMKAQGVTAGIPDICIDIPAGPYHGLRIELKRRGKPKPTEEQCRQLELRRQMGYHAVVCEGFDEARKATVQYLMKRGIIVDRWIA